MAEIKKSILGALAQTGNSAKSEAIEVTRCKDCRFYSEHICKRHMLCCVPTDWFCADAERRKDDKEDSDH